MRPLIAPLLITCSSVPGDWLEIINDIPGGAYVHVSSEGVTTDITLDTDGARRLMDWLGKAFPETHTEHLKEH